MKRLLPRGLPAAASLVLILGASGDALAREWFVSPAGDDRNPGTAAAPFATPRKAVSAVRELAATGLTGDVRVTFAGGTYELSAPLVFTPADSGTAEHSITYAAAPGQDVVFSGGRRIREWKVDGRRWTATLEGVRTGGWFFRLLVVDDERAIRARWPEADGALRLAEVSPEVRSFTFDRAWPTNDIAGQDAELVVYENWSISRALITAVRDGRIETANPVGWIGHGPATTASPGKPVFIEHARFALDRPGEWFLDRRTGELTYLARDGERPGNARVVAPVLSRLVQIAGTKDRPVRNLRFEGLRFEHAGFALPAFGYSELQAAHYGTTMQEPTYVQPVAIECAHAAEVRFEGCRFAHLNASGVGFGPGCRRNVVSRCTVEDIGGNGIVIGWRGTGALQAGAEGSLDADWADPSDAPAGNEVLDCVVRRCGADSRGGVGIYVAFSADTRIAHNEVCDLPYTGVSIGYRWNTTPTSQVRCVAEFNHIHHVMQKLADGGGIYTLGYQPGTVLRGNLIHDVPRSAFAHGGAPNNGFFIDEGSKGFLFESNVVYATSGRSVRFNQNQPEGHTWKANAFDEATTPEAIAEAVTRTGPTPIGHPFACTDYSAGKVCLVTSAGQVEWEYAAPNCNDLWALPNGNLLFNTGHGVREVTRAKEVVFDYQSTSEIYACQRLPDGNTFVGECNAGRLLEVAPDGRVVKEVRLLPEGKDGGHTYMRNARRLANGHYVVAHYGLQVVREYDATGAMALEIPAEGGPHSVVRLPNGHTLISCGDLPGGNRVFEANAAGRMIWEVRGDELPGISLKFMAGLQRLPNGNTVMCNWLGHGQLGRGPHLVEVTPDKRVAWSFADHVAFQTISSVQLLDVQGDAAPWAIAH
ncbi:MAG: right-handed parallel beta-helix repeat-containing protein [Verrucomicrobiales bacterium]|nr:right-handed parallel beta-helix repeat-containing protein [Verrucomicrobiales bacterium]MCP5526142.1 right-handed parallel beta-helix repeat-containing protein [Verrucomicrobiales bacterium]